MGQGLQIKRYLKEPFIYGGMAATREQIILDLHQLGGTDDMIDRYLQGLELGKEKIPEYNKIVNTLPVFKPEK